MSKKSLFILTSILSFFLLPSCQYIMKKSCCGSKKHTSLKTGKKSCCGKTSTAGQANVTGVEKTNIKGEIFFEQSEGYTVKVTANFTGLQPNKKFGFHVHEFGNCDNKALMAGGHFNPWNKKHGDPEGQEKHLGDMGNLYSDKKGSASYSAVLEGKARKFYGRSVVVHALPDDLKTQPTGQSGDRIACGIIVASMPPVFETQTENNKEKVEGKKQASSLINQQNRKNETLNQKNLNQSETNRRANVVPLKNEDINQEGQTGYASSLIGQPKGSQKTSNKAEVVQKKPAETSTDEDKAKTDENKAPKAGESKAPETSKTKSGKAEAKTDENKAPKAGESEAPKTKSKSK